MPTLWSKFLAALPRTQRAANTLLYVSPSRAVRLDTDRQGQAVGEVEAVDKLCPAVDDLLEVVEVAFHQRPPGRRLWLLYSGIETHSLTLPAAQVHGIGGAALTQALFFEIEALTGVSMVNRSIGYTITTSPDEEMRSFWVTLLPQRLFDRLVTTAHKLGARLKGVLHPGGLPAPVTAPLEPPWLRIEHWPEQKLCLAVRRRDEPPEVVIIPLEGLTRAAQKEFDEWVEDHPASVFAREALYADHKLGFGLEEGAAVDLSQPETLKSWLSAWAKVLTAESGQTPLIRTTPKVAREIVYLTASGALGVVIVGMHASWQTYLKWDYQRKTQELQAIEKRMEEYNQGIKARTEKLDALSQAIALFGDDWEQWSALIAKIQARPIGILETLAWTRPPTIVLTELRTDREGWSIAGVSVDFSAPNAYAAALQEKLARLGYQVAAPTKSDLKYAPSGGPWRFELKLADLGLEEVGDGLGR